MNEISVRENWEIGLDKEIRAHVARVKAVKAAFNSHDLDAVSRVVNRLQDKGRVVNKTTVCESVIDSQDDLARLMPGFDSVNLSARVRSFSYFDILLECARQLDDDVMVRGKRCFGYRNGWMRWALEKPGQWISENGKWVIRKEGRKFTTYLKDHYNPQGRFLRLENIAPCPTLEFAKDWVDEFDARGMDQLVENPRYPAYLPNE